MRSSTKRHLKNEPILTAWSRKFPPGAIDNQPWNETCLKFRTAKRGPIFYATNHVRSVHLPFHSVENEVTIQAWKLRLVASVSLAIASKLYSRTIQVIAQPDQGNLELTIQAWNASQNHPSSSLVPHSMGNIGNMKPLAPNRSLLATRWR